jgi:hypothetical protein
MQLVINWYSVAEIGFFILLALVVAAGIALLPGNKSRRR